MPNLKELDRVEAARKLLSELKLAYESLSGPSRRAVREVLRDGQGKEGECKAARKSA